MTRLGRTQAQQAALQFVSDWPAHDQDQLEASLAAFAGSGAYGTPQLRDALARFIFLRGGSDGEPLFGPETAVEHLQACLPGALHPAHIKQTRRRRPPRPSSPP